MTKHTQIKIAFAFALMGIMLSFAMGLLNSQARDTGLSQATFYVQ